MDKKILAMYLLTLSLVCVPQALVITPPVPYEVTVESVEKESVALVESEPIEETEPEYKMETIVTNAEFDLLADLVMAEAENQNFQAQYMVACVVLNRVKSDLFPDTIHDVIYAPSQFSCT